MSRGARPRAGRGGLLAGVQGTDHPWTAVGVIILGTFMVILDTMMVSVALPHIGRDLQVRVGIEWIVTGKLLALGVAQPVTGWVGDRFGEKEGFLGALGLFALASVIAAAAPTIGILIPARILQGAFGGIALPLSVSLLFAMFPVERRGTAVGLSGIMVMIAPALGPVLGGWIVSNASWRFIMLVNVPIALAGVVVGLRTIPSTGQRRDRPFDALGLLLVGAGLIALLVGLSYANQWGWLSPPFLTTVVGALTLLAAYGWRSTRVEHPLLNPAILADPVFRATIFIVWAVSLAQFGRMVFMPVELQVVRGMSAFEAGLIVAAAAVVSGIAMPFAGRWTDRAGPRLPAATGIVVYFVALVRLGTLTLDTPLWQIVTSVGLTGLGIVLVTMPVTVAGLNSISEHLGHRFVGEAAAVRSLNREIGGSVSTTVLAAIVIFSIGSLDVSAASEAELIEAQLAYNRVYLAGLAGLAVAVLLLRRLPHGPARPAEGMKAGHGPERTVTAEEL